VEQRCSSAFLQIFAPFFFPSAPPPVTFVLGFAGRIAFLTPIPSLLSKRCFFLSPCPLISRALFPSRRIFLPPFSGEVFFRSLVFPFWGFLDIPAVLLLVSLLPSFGWERPDPPLSPFLLFFPGSLLVIFYLWLQLFGSNPHALFSFSLLCFQPFISPPPHHLKAVC